LDLSISSGSLIHIEERPADELTRLDLFLKDICFNSLYSYSSQNAQYLRQEDRG